MNDKDFANLVESIKQAGQIKKGLLKPSRTFEFNSKAGIDSPRNTQVTVTFPRNTPTFNKSPLPTASSK